MGRLDVTLKLSTFPSAKHAAHWDINGDTGTITVNLPEMWREIKGVVDARIARKNPGLYEFPATVEEKYINEFLGDLAWSYLMERVCLERGHEKWRIKGKRCGTPYRSSCCVRYPVELMQNPDYWPQIRRNNNRRPYQARIAGADRLPCLWFPKSI